MGLLYLWICSRTKTEKKICETLGWEGYPSTERIGKLKSFKTHDLEMLLHFQGLKIGSRVKY